MIVNLHNKGGEHIASWRLPDGPVLPPNAPYPGPKLLFWPTDSISERGSGQRFTGRFFMLDTASVTPQPGDGSKPSERMVPAYREIDLPTEIGELPK